jgi:hypothetical protein
MIKKPKLGNNYRFDSCRIQRISRDNDNNYFDRFTSISAESKCE